jgi:CDP-diglyceride synthetase
MKISRFVLGVVALAVLLWASAQWFAMKGLIDAIPSYWLEILLLLSISTIVIFYFLQKMNATEPLDFVKNFLLSVVLKILLSGVFVFILIKLDPVRANGNALFFMISYLFFTGYEVIVLTKKKNAE